MALSKRLFGWGLWAAALPCWLAAQQPQEDKKPRSDDPLYDELMSLLNTKVETASKGQKQSLSDAPAIVSVVTGDEIRALGYTSVAQALAAVPGMYAIDDRVAPNFGVRGINGGLRAYSRIIKVMIDGQPISFRPDATNFLGPELIGVEAVERIEVVRGPASSLYGANAFLGVVNVITRKPEAGKTGGAVVVRGGSGSNQSLTGLEARVNTANERWGCLFAFSGSQTDLSGATLPASSPLLLPRPDLAGVASSGEKSRPLSALLSVSFTPSQQAKLELLSHFSRLDAYGEFLDFGTLSHQNRIQLDNGFTRLRGEWSPSTTFTLNGSIAMASGKPGSREHLSSGEVASHPKRDLSYNAQDATVEGRWSFRAKDSLTIGADRSSEDNQLMTVYSVNEATGAATATIGQQPRKTFTNTGLYAQYMTFPMAQLGLTLNARSDHHNIYGTKATYRVGLVYQAGQGIHGKLLYGTSFKAPAAWQLYAQPLFGGEVVGNPALKPETASTVEMEVGWKPSETMSFTLNAFKNRVEDKVELLPRLGNQVPINAGLQDSHGVEGQATLGLGSHLFTGSFAWQKTDAHTPVPFMPDRIEPTSLYPSVTAFLRWRFLYASGQAAGMEARYASERRASASNISENLLHPYQLDAYTRLDAFWSGQWPLKKGSLRTGFRVDNLFDKKIVESGFQGVDIPEPGRRAVLNVSFQF